MVKLIAMKIISKAIEATPVKNCIEGYLKSKSSYHSEELYRRFTTQFAGVVSKLELLVLLVSTSPKA